MLEFAIVVVLLIGLFVVSHKISQRRAARENRQQETLRVISDFKYAPPSPSPNLAEPPTRRSSPGGTTQTSAARPCVPPNPRADDDTLQTALLTGLAVPSFDSSPSSNESCSASYDSSSSYDSGSSDSGSSGGGCD